MPIMDDPSNTQAIPTVLSFAVMEKSLFSTVPDGNECSLLHPETVRQSALAGNVDGQTLHSVGKNCT